MPQVLPNSRIEGNAFTRTRIFDAPAPMRFWHLASLDAPTVALVWSLAFAWIGHVRLPLWVPALLTLAVWAAYVSDRILDAHRALRSNSVHRLRDRHLYHWRHRRILLPLAAAAASAAAWIIFDLMPVVARERNSILAAASLVYFTRVHTGRTLSPLLPKLFSKEFLVGLLFTIGCVIPTWSRISTSTASLFFTLLIPAAFFALLAWLNCRAIDQWESDSRSPSGLTIFSLSAIIALCGLLLAACLSTQPRTSALVLAGSAAALLLATLDKLRTRLAPVALRAAADLVLLTPVLLIPFANFLK